MGRIDTYPAQAPVQAAMLAYAAKSSNQAGIGATEVDITELTVTISVPAGRRIKLTSGALLDATVVNDFYAPRIKEGTQVLQVAVININPIGQGLPWEQSVVLSPSAGTHTYKVTMQRIGGTGTGSFLANPANNPAYLLAEDITGLPGPVGAASVPVGQLAYAQVTANQSGITTEVDITGLIVNVVVPAGRTLRITGFLCPFTTVADDTFLGRIYQDGVQIQQGLVGMHITATGYTLPLVTEVSPSAGAHTYKITGMRNNGSGSESNFAAAANPCFIMVEDITPTPTPANTAPSSTLGYAEITANQGSITTQTDITSLSVSVTVVAGRRLRITGVVLFQNTGAGNQQVLTIQEDGSNIRQAAVVSGAANVTETCIAQTSRSPSAGSHTYKLQASAAAGTTTVTAGASNQCYILVEDITGAAVSTYGFQSIPAQAIASEAWTTYTPLWQSNGTAPAVGNSTLTGRYIKLGRLVIGSIYFQVGTTATMGTGVYYWSLPVAPYTGQFGYQIIGQGKGYHGGSNINAVATLYASTQNVRCVYSATWPAGAETWIAQTTPWTWANPDDLTINFMYEAVS